ncbi:MAG: riboflavin synthase [Akkermansiaceae bacterium]|nr:riboflavin synthase [Akkermansia sp.]MCD7799308.1 riboflavin synthase [Akkermansiaceae bacterium]MCD8070084.1 riboflavin synthase [Akkermansiaceae bacterium]
MFTGLVESVGSIVRILPIAEGARFTISIPFASEMSLGDSIAVNGCCLTVNSIENNLLSFDILTQTMRVTMFHDLRIGDRVNLERAMGGAARFGGHFVMGHVDTCGEVISIESVGQDHKLLIRIPEKYSKYCIDKGSIAIDGISLTIAHLDGCLLEFWLIPHTFTETNLHDTAPGRRVNVEVDMMAKYIEKLLPSVRLS